ncbi:MAG: tetratricopeptide repeat protein [Candidatus Omnitrophota bacterium]
MGSKKNLIISIILIVVLGLAIYWNSLDGKFIWDDIPIIRDNAYIRSFSHIDDIFTKSVIAGAGKDSGFYRPVYISTYLLNYSLSGLNTVNIHLTNVMFHILVALAVFWLINILFDDRPLSLLTSLLFLVHPVHTEVVSYMSGRVDSLITLFMLCALIFYIKSLRRKSVAFYAAMIISYCLALMTKENALIFPFLVVLYHYSFKNRDGKMRRYSFFPLIAISLIYLLSRLTFFRSAPLDILQILGVFERLPGFFVAIANYLRILILPIALHMEYGNSVFSYGDIKAIAGLLASAFIIMYAFKRRDRNPLVFFSVMWFFILLLPVSNLYPIAFYMAEHYLYLPSIGFFLILSYGLRTLYRRREFKVYAGAVTTILVLSGSILTINQNNYWKEPITFYERTLRYAPESARVYNNLANCYREAGRIDRAEVYYKKAIQRDGNNADAHSNMAIIYRDLGRIDESIALYRKAIELNSGHPHAYSNLGIAYYVSGDIDAAIDSYKRALKINPNRSDVYYNLGIAYASSGKKKEAIDAYIKSLELSPNDPDVYINLGNTYKKDDKADAALDSYKQAIKLAPDMVAPYNNIGLIYYGKKEYTLAAQYLEKARHLGQNINPDILLFLEPYRKD